MNDSIEACTCQHGLHHKLSPQVDQPSIFDYVKCELAFELALTNNVELTILITGYFRIKLSITARQYTAKERARLRASEPLIEEFELQFLLIEFPVRSLRIARFTYLESEEVSMWRTRASIEQIGIHGGVGHLACCVWGGYHRRESLGTCLMNCTLRQERMVCAWSL
ncbi:uncharacterized protein BO72DRAFT_272257 [Aspergillus fijiensis CBS 313.89]|uniref:Uncharacterized protein n=1 Tax=Aspergillus fijiensis CBS 313.89 TaxID=1448319 RepID=A0A8G1VX13_9EURO|nr:uncharacterized protein BO72DRAFT_272257 [Aspergillus fijiensis CBS 313.89]RAK72544.1 hypothetical protein BO72DRAFT_272257 [Aspergillus fijiensis CBS 313.89]